MRPSPALTPEGLAAGGLNPIAKHYGRFRVAERLLLTGHSHQAWPDVTLEAQEQAWLDASEFVDDKWERAFEGAEVVRRGIRRLLDDPSGEIALGQNTFDLVARFLSALRMRDRPCLITTDGEFHTIRRLLDRLEEEGIEIVRVPALPVETLAERMATEVDGRTAAALVSKVLFESGRIVPGLSRVMEACEREGAELLVDAYHAVNVVPFSLSGEGLESAWVVGGGYKYLQWGEGCCFLRFPAHTTRRPVLTGWFSEFGVVTGPGEEGNRGEGAEGARFDTGKGPSAGPRVPYGEGPARFAGSTYDPTAHYRAAAALEHFTRLGLGPRELRAISLHQVRRIVERFRAGDLDPALLALETDFAPEERGGFVVLRSPRASAFVKELREVGVFADARGNSLRLGPAPYLSDAQLVEGVDRLLTLARR